MVRQNQCLCCAGSGACLRCDGWGSQWSVVNGRTHRRLCPDCRGVGACAACAGRGRSMDAGSHCPFLRRWFPVKPAAR